MFDFINNVDQNMIMYIDTHIFHGFIISLFKTFTIAGNYGILWIIILTGISLYKKNRNIWLLWGFSFILLFLGGEILLKNIFHRNRPFIDFPQLIISTVKPLSYSFPSSHASLSGAAFFIINTITASRTFAILIFIISLSVSLSRVVLKVHYPSDVLAGYLFGLCIAWMVHTLLTRTKKKPHYS